MKVLFICRSNAERSIIAETLFNSFSKKHKASSAGADVTAQRREGSPPGRVISELMLSMGHDVLQMKSRQLTPKMVKEADKVVVILSKSEVRKYLPGYVKNSRKTIFWTVKLTPHSIYATFPPRTYNYHLRWLDLIHANVRKLVREMK